MSISRTNRAHKGCEKCSYAVYLLHSCWYLFYKHNTQCNTIFHKGPFEKQQIYNICYEGSNFCAIKVSPIYVQYIQHSIDKNKTVILVHTSEQQNMINWLQLRKAPDLESIPSNPFRLGLAEEQRTEKVSKFAGNLLNKQYLSQKCASILIVEQPSYY